MSFTLLGSESIFIEMNAPWLGDKYERDKFSQTERYLEK